MPHISLIVDGVRLPSVTEILGDKPKPWLEAWRAKWGVLAERKTVAASNVGSKFHDCAERLIKNEVVAISNNRLFEMLNQFENWRYTSGFKAKETELHVVSRKYKYQGTFDAVGTLKDTKGLVIFDWKTSSGIYEDMQLQIAAYAQAYEEQAGIKIRTGVIVHISKDKPHHKLTVKSYKITKSLVNKFLKRLEKFNEVRA